MNPILPPPLQAVRTCKGALKCQVQPNYSQSYAWKQANAKAQVGDSVSDPKQLLRWLSKSRDILLFLLEFGCFR